MGRIPFKKFVTTLLLFNKSVPQVVEKLKSFNYNSTDDIVSSIFHEVRGVLPESIREVVNAGRILDLNNKSHVEWIQTLGILEFYDFIVNQGQNPENPPEYFKWCRDCMWAHGHKDVMTLINILMFNDEPFESISKIIMFKFKKKIGADALQLYKDTFWNTDGMTAKDAFFYCLPFRNSALIVRQIRSGTEISMVNDDTRHDGCDVPVTFHDVKYIKWKVGYLEDVEVPNTKTFMERIKRDAFYRYYESMCMTQSIEEEEGSGTNDKIGAFDETRTKRRNVEEQRAKMAKHWLDIYLKADNAMPSDSSKSDDFFNKMDQLQMEFEGEGKIVGVDDMAGMFEDIKGDIQ